MTKKAELPVTLYQDCKSKKYSMKELSLKYNHCEATIKKLIIDNNLPYFHRNIRAKVNDHYFNNINTNDRAYFLGLLYADGNICDNKSHKLEIQLALTDLNLVELFKSYTESKSNIKTYVYNNPNHKNSYKLSIKSEQMFNDLISLGCFPRKSLILKFPVKNLISENLFSHFIRGYFDGDGSIYIKNYNKARVSIAGTEHMLLGIQEVLKTQANINSHIAKVKNIFILTLSGTNQIMKFKNFIYKGKSDLYLKRKYERFEILQEEQISRINKKLSKK